MTGSPVKARLGVSGRPLAVAFKAATRPALHDLRSWTRREVFPRASSSVRVLPAFSVGCGQCDRAGSVCFVSPVSRSVRRGAPIVGLGQQLVTPSQLDCDLSRSVTFVSPIVGSCQQLAKELPVSLPVGTSQQLVEPVIPGHSVLRPLKHLSPVGISQQLACPRRGNSGISPALLMAIVLAVTISSYRAFAVNSDDRMSTPAELVALPSASLPVTVPSKETPAGETPASVVHGTRAVGGGAKRGGGS